LPQNASRRAQHRAVSGDHTLSVPGRTWFSPPTGELSLPLDHLVPAGSPVPVEPPVALDPSVTADPPVAVEPPVVVEPPVPEATFAASHPADSADSDEPADAGYSDEPEAPAPLDLSDEIFGWEGRR
jgi:hypothetical protein